MNIVYAFFSFFFLFHRNVSKRKILGSGHVSLKLHDDGIDFYRCGNKTGGCFLTLFSCKNVFFFFIRSDRFELVGTWTSELGKKLNDDTCNEGWDRADVWKLIRLRLIREYLFDRCACRALLASRARIVCSDRARFILRFNGSRDYVWVTYFFKVRRMNGWYYF